MKENSNETIGMITQILAILGGAIAGLIAAIYTFALIGFSWLSILLCVSIIGLGVFCGNIWRSRFAMFSFPLLFFMATSMLGGRVRVRKTDPDKNEKAVILTAMFVYFFTCLFFCFMLITLLYDPSFLLIPAIPHAAFAAYVIVFDPFHPTVKKDLEKLIQMFE
ncbi:MAG: hypothetical protein AAGD96_34650 [Chloroflexota bacterium]